MKNTDATMKEEPMKGNFKFDNKMTGDVFGTGKEMPLIKPDCKFSTKGTNMGKKD